MSPEDQLRPEIVQWANGDRGTDGLLPEPTVNVLGGHDLGGRRGLQGRLSKVVQRANVC